MCKPLAKRIQPKGAIIIAALCVPLGYALTIPIAVAFRTHAIPGGRTICYPDTSSNPAVKWILKINFPITFLGWLLLVVVCYSLIYSAIRKQMHIRAQMMTGSGKSSGVLSVVGDATTNSSDQKTGQTSFVGSKSEITVEPADPNSHALSEVSRANVSDVCVKVIPESTTASKSKTETEEKVR